MRFINKKSRSLFSRAKFASTPQVKPKQFLAGICKRCPSVSPHPLFLAFTHRHTRFPCVCWRIPSARAYRAFTLGPSSSSSSSASLSAKQFHVLNLVFAGHTKENDKHVRKDDWGKGLEGRVLTPHLHYSLPRLPPLQDGRRETGKRAIEWCEITQYSEHSKAGTVFIWYAVCTLMIPYISIEYMYVCSARMQK